MRLFYDHLLVELDDVYAEVERLKITSDEKKKLVKIIDSTSHHTVLDVIFEKLHQHHHRAFLKIFHSKPHHPENIKFLRTHIADIDDQIIRAVKKLKSTLLAEFNS